MNIKHIKNLNINEMQCRTVTPGRRYTVGSAGAIFYVAGGASDDYAKVIRDKICKIQSCISHRIFVQYP